MRDRVYIVYRGKTGRVLRWYKTDQTRPEAIPLAADEFIAEMPGDLYRVTNNAVELVQSWLNTRTLRDPKDDDEFVIVDRNGDPVRRVYVRDPDNPEASLERGQRLRLYRDVQAERLTRPPAKPATGGGI